MAIDIYAEPLYYGRRLIDAVWLKRQIGQSHIPCHTPGHLHRMASFRSSPCPQPSLLSTIYIFRSHHYLHRSLHILSSARISPGQVEFPTRHYLYTLSDMTITALHTSTVFDPELHYGHSNDNALYNLFATWLESYFSSLPKPYGYR